MTKNIIIKTSVQKRFDSFMVHGRVLFFSAPCGFGKTVLADALLRGRNVLRQSAADPDCVIPPSAQDWDILLIDDLQLMQEEAGQQALCELIRSSPEHRFVLLSRGVPPGCLTAFQYTGLMTVLEADDLLFDAGDVRRLFQLSGVNVTDSEIDGILKESVGYPLGVAITARCMSPDKPWTPELVARVFHEVFLYFETAIYRRFDLPVRRFLLELAPFESFDLEMARMVSGDPRAGERLDWIFRYTTMLRYDDCQRFHFWSGFRAFLLWEMEREYTEEKRKALISRGGLYYELKEDYAHALECYTSGGDHSKVSELLVRNAELHPGMGHYAEMEKYYRSLPEAEILASPSLMQGMSMLCALVMDYEGSERWYGELQKFAEHCDRQDAAGKQARGRLAWLDISLPQRGVKGLTETIPAVFRLLTNKEVALPSFSVTSALPSIMNGGKDFSEWSKKDDLLYKTLRIPVEAVLGRDGVCLADCAIAESKFEKGEESSGQIITLVSRLSEIQAKGTPDIEFALVGLLARSQMLSGCADAAAETVNALRIRFAEQGKERFLANIDALLCQIALKQGDMMYVGAWYREKAPKDILKISILKRCQYLTRAAAEIALRESEIRAEEYSERYPEAEKVLGEIKAKLEYSDDRYMIIVPQKISEIVAEGRVLEHCVGKVDRYFDRIAQRETYICFLRKTEEPTVPYYTIEVEPGGTIRQHRGFDDKEPEINKIKPFLREWQKEIRKRMSKEDHELASVSEVKREENIKELQQKNNTRVLEGLMQDFMEAAG